MWLPSLVPQWRDGEEGVTRSKGTVAIRLAVFARAVVVRTASLRMHAVMHGAGPVLKSKRTIRSCTCCVTEVWLTLKGGGCSRQKHEQAQVGEHCARH